MRKRLADAGWVTLGTVKGLAAAGIVLYAAQAAFAVCGSAATPFFEEYVYTALILLGAGLCAARAATNAVDRGAWACIAVGLFAWGAGEVVYSALYQEMDVPPVPSAADVLWLSFYPACYAGMVLLLRGRLRQFDRSLWLDGLIGALAAGALGATLVFGVLTHPASGDAAGTDLAFLLGDLLLLGFVVMVFALTGWRPGRAWGLLGAGLAASASVDGLFLYLGAVGSYAGGEVLSALWPASALLLGFAAWGAPARVREIRYEGWRMLAVPMAFAALALGLLIWHAIDDINPLGLALAAATLGVVLVRMGFALRQNAQLLAGSRVEALTDPLTGLGNRRKLLLDLDEQLELASEEEPRALLLLDLDGFKLYNDRFGHPAGDALLARLGPRFDAAIAPFGAAYRLGGDEFCAIVSGSREEAQAVVGAAQASMAETGRGFDITSSCGYVILPREASDSRAALKIADQRVYAEKGRRQRFCVGRQTGDALLQALEERDPELREHLGDVAELALSVGQRLGLDQQELDDLICAAELHDVGKVGVPSEILHKPGPLTDSEWAIMYEHTVAGDRILSAAPALAEVAKIVRSSHERYDGAGYPDGLSGKRIPLGARIVAVCDAYDAMTTDRPYRRAMPVADALAELRGCAGRQFDPDVVDAFCSALEMPDWTSDAPPAWRALRDTSRMAAA